MKLKHKLFLLFILVGLIPISIISVNNLRLIKNDEYQHKKTSEIEILKNIEMRIADVLKEIEYDVEMISITPLLQYESDEDFTSFLNADENTFEYKIKEHEQSIVNFFSIYKDTKPYVNSVYYGTVNGHFVRSHKRAEPTQYDPRERPWYKLAINNLGIVSNTEPYKSVTTDDINIGTVKTIKNDKNEILGVVGIDITLYQLSELIELDINSEEYIFILTEKDKVLIHPDKSYFLKDLDSLEIEGSNFNKYDVYGSFEFTENNIDKILYYYNSTNFGWTYCKVLPKSIILDVLNKKYISVIFSSSILVIVSIIAIGWFGNIFTRNILIIEKAMKKVEKGEMDVSIDLKTKDELSMIASGLNKMLTSLKDSLYIRAYFDNVTGLINREKFKEIFDLILSNNTKGSLIQVNIRNFKMYNKIYGYDFGDKVLSAISEKLSSVFDENTVISRISGNCFAIVLDYIYDEDLIYNYLENIKNCFDKKLNIDSVSLIIDFYIGIVIYSEMDNDSEQMLQDVNLTSVFAKNKIESNYQYLNNEIKEKLKKNLNIEKELKDALERNEFYLKFQPIINMNTGSVHGFESLLRWENPELGLISPDIFIPIAEKNFEIVKIGKCVLEQACFFGKEINAISEKKYKMSVNVSVIQFMQLDFINLVKEILLKTGFESKYLVIEITESVLFEDNDGMRDKLNEIKLMGIDISLDDFGKGYSSLNMLLWLPLSYVKIDKIFLWESMGKPKMNNLIKSVITYANSMGLEVVIEGIETDLMAQKVIDLEANYGQGFLYHKPLSKEEAKDLIEKEQ